MSLHPGSPANRLWSRFGNHVAYHVSVTSHHWLKVVLLKRLFKNFTFEIGFERSKRQFSQNKDMDGTRSTKIHELKHFQFGAVTTAITIQTTTNQLSTLKEIWMQQTAKTRTLDPLEYHISVQVSTLRLFYASTSLIFPTEEFPVYCWSRIHRIAWFYAFNAPVFKNFLKIPKSFAQTKL